ncbi:MAG: S8 family serine peptidase [Pseudomonadota bacterium]
MPKTKKGTALGALARVGLTASVTALAASANAADITTRPSHKGVEAARLTTPVRRAAPAAPAERADYLVRLRAAPAARGGALANIDAEHASFRRDRLAKLRGRVISELRLATNGFLVNMSESEARSLREDRRVLSVRRTGIYTNQLEDTVPYIGASAVQELGFDGAGIKVAVFDSGIDYTHADLGGEGTLEAYEAAYGTDTSDSRNTSRDGLFPTDRVVEGFDFVGEVWPNGDLIQDDDPIDFEGHGSSVADIIGGNIGVAPGVDLYAVKVCSAVSSSCSGTALIQGMEYALDPNGDGNMDDRVDIINMSLGANYGQPFDDDLSAAVDSATAAGVLTVASAGNSADNPYITGTPAAAATALSVAQTQVPSAGFQQAEIEDFGNVDASFQTWSGELTEVISGVVQYGDGEGGALDGCSLDPDNPTESNPFPPGSLDGQIVMVDRGVCFFSEKIFNIEQAGGILGIIAQNTPDAPFPGGFGDNTPEPLIPGFMIGQTSGDPLRGSDTVVTFDPANVRSLVGSVVASSSRGPSGFDNRIKPEIGAPGANVSVATGTGTARRVFGGTSGAAPMVAGSAALLLQASPGSSPLDLKQALINGAETDIQNDDTFSLLAPISRIGGGEVRVDSSFALPAVAYDADDEAGGGLSFGVVRAGRTTATRVRNLAVKNISDEPLSYTVTPTFRYEEDAASGAAAVEVAETITVAPGSTATVPVTLSITPANLPDNAMDSGLAGNDPGPLTTQEIDGYLVLTAEDHELTVPWHVLPLKVAHTIPDSFEFSTGGEGATVGLTNFAFGTAQIDTFSLLGTSDDLPEGDAGAQSPVPDLRAVGVATFESTCAAGFTWAFGVNAWETATHLFPVRYQVVLDTNRDGIDDFAIFNQDLDPAVSNSNQATFVEDLATGAQSAFFFTVHSMNSGNVQLLICGEQVGLTAEDIGVTPVDARFEAIDFYFGTGVTDTIDGITITPAGEQYVGAVEDIPGRTQGLVEISDFGKLPENSQEIGVMLMTDGVRALPGAASRRTAAVLLEATE